MTPQVEEALCRSALYEALALGFRPPTDEVVSRLASGGAAGMVAAAGRLDPDLAGLARRLGHHRVEELRASYRDLFGHTVRCEVPAYETEYGGDGLFLQSHELADIGGFYAAFGLDLAPGERADHVSAECEFLMFLARKEALALERHEPDTLAAVQRAARLFVRDHLGRFVPALAARLERADRDGFYGVLGALSAAFIGRECQRLDVPPGAPALPLRPTADDGVPMACGTCGVGAAADGD